MKRDAKRTQEGETYITFDDFLGHRTDDVYTDMKRRTYH